MYTLFYTINDMLRHKSNIKLSRITRIPDGISIRPLYMSFPVNMPLCASPALYWADAGSIGPVQARYWHITACLQGMTCKVV